VVSIGCRSRPSKDPSSREYGLLHRLELSELTNWAYPDRVWYRAVSFRFYFDSTKLKPVGKKGKKMDPFNSLNTIKDCKMLSFPLPSSFFQNLYVGMKHSDAS
jgi:hypothetical protein